jgi:hypothetical protein
MQWPNEKGQKNKQWSTQHFTENKAPVKANFTKNLG